MYPLCSLSFTREWTESVAILQCCLLSLSVTSITTATQNRQCQSDWIKKNKCLQVEDSDFVFSRTGQTVAVFYDDDFHIGNVNCNWHSQWWSCRSQLHEEMCCIKQLVCMASSWGQGLCAVSFCVCLGFRNDHNQRQDLVRPITPKPEHEIFGIQTKALLKQQ